MTKLNLNLDADWRYKLNRTNHGAGSNPVGGKRCPHPSRPAPETHSTSRVVSYFPPVKRPERVVDNPTRVAFMAGCGVNFSFFIDTVNRCSTVPALAVQCCMWIVILFVVLPVVRVSTELWVLTYKGMTEVYMNLVIYILTYSMDQRPSW
jgi:hypothetical protein